MNGGLSGMVTGCRSPITVCTPLRMRVCSGWRTLTHFPSPHSPPNSPVYKAVSPIEAATVDEVDTFLEVLFAREESKKVLSAGVGGTGLQEAVPPLHFWDGKRQTKSLGSSGQLTREVTRGRCCGTGGEVCVQ